MLCEYCSAKEAIIQIYPAQCAFLERPIWVCKACAETHFGIQAIFIGLNNISGSGW